MSIGCATYDRSKFTRQVLFADQYLPRFSACPVTMSYFSTTLLGCSPRLFQHHDINQRLPPKRTHQGSQNGTAQQGLGRITPQIAGSESCMPCAAGHPVLRSVRPAGPRQLPPSRAATLQAGITGCARCEACVARCRRHPALRRGAWNDLLC